MLASATKDHEASEGAAARWAADSATFGFAAAAAGLLAANPEQALSVRFTAALRAVRERLNEVLTFATDGSLEVLYQQMEPKPDPDRMIAQLVGDSEPDVDLGRMSDGLARVVGLVDVCLDQPTAQAAAELRPYLLSVAESMSYTAQASSSDLLDVEVSFRPTVTM